MLVQLFSARVPFPIGIFSIVHFWNWNMKDQQVVCVESRVNPQLDETLYQEDTQDQQDQRESKFADDKDLSEASLAATGRKAAAFSFRASCGRVFDSWNSGIRLKNRLTSNVSAQTKPSSAKSTFTESSRGRISALGRTVSRPRVLADATPIPSAPAATAKTILSVNN
jgi:hypothetical protein